MRSTDISSRRVTQHWEKPNSTSMRRLDSGTTPSLYVHPRLPLLSLEAANHIYIQSGILKSLISETSPAGGQPAFKYAINSTIIQHLVPSSALHKPRAPTTSTSTSTDQADIKSESAVESKSDTKPREGRRGLHSATGAYWNEQTDGMWSYKYDGGEGKGLDVVISVIWIGL